VGAGHRLAIAGNALGGRVMTLTGRVGELGTIGARSGLPRRAPVGFVPLGEGRILVGAVAGNRGWAANLRANPEATFRVGRVERRYRARPVAPAARAAAIAALRRRFGLLASRTEWGPLFVLNPAAEA